MAQPGGGPKTLPQVAVVGGGLAGAVACYVLTARGAAVTLIDMGKQMPGQ